MEKKKREKLGNIVLLIFRKIWLRNCQSMSFEVRARISRKPEKLK